MARVSILISGAIFGVLLLFGPESCRGFHKISHNEPVHRGYHKSIRGPICVAGPSLPTTTFNSLYEAQEFSTYNTQNLVVLHMGPCNCPNVDCFYHSCRQLYKDVC